MAAGWRYDVVVLGAVLNEIRGAWEPLLEVYAQLGDVDRLNDRVSQLIDALLEPQLRNRARMVKGRLLAKVEGREYDAVDVLRNVLDEEPDHSEAAALLTELYERVQNDPRIVAYEKKVVDCVAEQGWSTRARTRSTTCGRTS